MKAMIFAAGLGTRLKPFTEHHPKALVPVNGVPMLQRVLENVADAGVRAVVVNIHHFASQITDFLAANNNFGLNIKLSDESDCLLDTGGGLLKARDLLLAESPQEPVLLHNADILTNCDLRQMLSVHQSTGADVTLLCSQRHSSRTLWFSPSDNRLLGWENLSTGETRPEGFLPADVPEASPSPFGGIHIINPSIFSSLQKFCGATLHPFSIIPFYLDMIGDLRIQRFMLPSGSHWFDVGSAEKLAAAEAAIPESL